VSRPDLVPAYLRWSLARSAAARGWWTVTAVYLVVVASLRPFELVLIGTFQGLTVVLTELPAGVLADRVSRRLALVVAHVVSGTGMALAAAVHDFPSLVVANCLWGMGWAFASGADVAWITDELVDDADVSIDGVLAAQGRWDLLGNPVGIALFGLLAWATSLATAMACAGMCMAALGIVVARWPERPRRHVDDVTLVTWRTILDDGVRMARIDRVLLAVLASNALLNGSAEGYGRLYERRLVTLGLPNPPTPIVWFTALGLATVVLRVATLRAMERRIEQPDTARRSYVLSCVVGAVGLVLFAFAPSAATAVAAAFVVSGLGAIPRVAATIRVNRRTTSTVRATVHSLLSWSENVGEIVFGLTLALIAAATTATIALLAAAVLLALAGAVGAVHDTSG
jgi:MFS family permease